MENFDPEQVLTQLDEHVKPTASVADFGCGAGFFSLPCAQKYSGTVYCFDVLEGALESVDSKAKTFGLRNLVTKRVNLEADQSTALEDGSVQLVIARNILWQNNDAAKLLSEAHRILDPEGRLLIIALDSAQKMPGIPEQAYDVESMIEKELEKNHFAVETHGHAGPQHHLIIARRT